MTPLAVGPVLALIGIVAAFFVLRGKAKTRKSMYRTLRERRELDLRKARERAIAAKGAATAAAAQPPTGPASAAAIRSPVEDAPAYTPQEPTYTPPEPPSAPPPAPAKRPPIEELPEPPSSAGDQTKPSWEIVQPDKPAAEGGRGARSASAGSGRASWELDPLEQQRINDRHKRRGRRGDEEEGDEGGEETLAQVLLSYAGLVAALLVILLGIFFMIGGR